MHEILLRETLRAGNNPDKDAKLVRIDFFDMGTALSRGDIDACPANLCPRWRSVPRQATGDSGYPQYGEGIRAISTAV